MRRGVAPPPSPTPQRASRSIALAKAAKSIGHAVLARSCAVNAPRRRSTYIANAAKSTPSVWATVENTHAVLASYCAENAPRRRCTAIANAAKNIASAKIAVPKVHAVFARFCAMNEPRRRSTALANAAALSNAGWPKNFQNYVQTLQKSLKT